MLMTIVRISSVMLVVTILFAGLAMAQEPGGTTISAGGFVGTLMPYIAEAALAIITALVAWVSMSIKKRTGLEIESYHREALTGALAYGMHYALATVQARADTLTIDVKSPLIAEAAGYVQRSVPDALAFFKITPELLKERLVARFSNIDDAA